MTDHNLRYYGLASISGLTAIGWVLNKLTPEITSAIFVALGALITADVIKHRNDTPKA